MAVGVVDGLEVVEVEENQREGVADALGPAPFQRELLVEPPAVRQAGERVRRRLRDDPAEVAEAAQDRPAEEQARQEKEAEGADRRVEDPMLVRRDRRADRALWPEREQMGPGGVRNGR